MAYPAAKSGFTLEDLTKMGPDEITRKRKIAEALLAQSQGVHPIANPLEGMAQMAQALVGNLKLSRLDRAEREGKEGANALFGAGFGTGQYPAAPPGGASTGSDYSQMADGPKGMESYLSNIRSAESGGNDSAKNPTSSATGRYQFIGSTWDGLMKNHPELGLTADGRTDPAQQERAIRQFTADNGKVLSSAGIPLTGGNLYAAHFLGAGGAAKVLSSNPSASVESIVGPDVVRANSFLRGMTVADFSRWAAKKGGGGAVAMDGAAPAQTQVASLDPKAGVEQAMREQGQDPNDPLSQALVKLKQQNPDGSPAPVVPPQQAAIGAALTGQPVPTSAKQALFVPGVSDKGLSVQPIPNAQPLAAGADPMSLMDPAVQTGKPQGPGSPGEIRQGADGKTYQYAETTGMAGATGPQGWIETNQAAQPQQQQIGQALVAQNDPAQTLGAPAISPQGPDMRTLMNMAGNEFMSPSQQKMIEALTGQRMQQADPGYQMELEQKRLQLDALKNPKKDYKFITGKDGSIFRADEGGALEQVYGGKPETFRTLTPEEEVKAGLDPAGAYQMGPDNKISKIGGEGTTVNIDQKAEGAFEKKLGEKQAETFDAMSTEGMNAKAELGVIGELDNLLKGQGGTLSGIAGMAAKWGIGGEGMDDIQATQAIINKLIPTQRQPGSGTMSDRDVEMFTRSLPSLWNQPGGNEKILKVMRGLATYKQAQGEIADQVLTGEISRQEARQMLRQLPNPLEGFGETPRQSFDKAAEEKPIDQMTDEELRELAK